MAAPTLTHDGQSDSQPPTVAAFSPSTITGSALTSRQRSSVIVHRKSPLLVATPPPITRALAYSHPFLLPLNKLLGVLTWTNGDPWQGFLLVACFWTVVLYSDAVILWAGPILVVLGLILGMYTRRYSPLSSTSATGEKHQKRTNSSENGTRHQKSLDEIVETLRTFTIRCNILLEPLLDLTDFLSTQRTATSATTKPALTALFLRILLITPIWVILTLPPFYIITTRRVVMTVGTLILTYHSRPARVSRVILWRSRTVRRIVAMLTGLSIADSPDNSQKAQAQGLGLNIATRRRRSADGVRFTFIVYENQRRWLGIGWTYSLFPAERAAWTDEHLNAVSPKDKFELPDVPSGDSKWRWVEGSEWRVEGKDGSPSRKSDSKSLNEGWVYSDNKVNPSLSFQENADQVFSGTTVAAVKTDGTGTPGGASGTATRNSSKSDTRKALTAPGKQCPASHRRWSANRKTILGAWTPTPMPMRRASPPRPPPPNLTDGAGSGVPSMIGPAAAAAAGPHLTRLAPPDQMLLLPSTPLHDQLVFRILASRPSLVSVERALEAAKTAVW